MIGDSRMPNNVIKINGEKFNYSIDTILGYVIHHARWSLGGNGITLEAAVQSLENECRELYDIVSEQKNVTKEFIKLSKFVKNVIDKGLNYVI